MGSASTCAALTRQDSCFTDAVARPTTTTDPVARAGLPSQPTCFRRLSPVGGRTPRVACAVVCVLATLSSSSAYANSDRGTVSLFVVNASRAPASADPATDGGILAKRVDLDMRLRRTMIDQPRWMAVRVKAAVSSRKLFSRMRRPFSSEPDALESKRDASSLRVFENSFPNRKVALQGAVHDGVFLNVSLGMDHELEHGSIGRATPSIGLQFEHAFR